MLRACDVSETQVTLARWRPSFCPNGNLNEGDRQWGDSHGTTDFQVPGAPIGLSFPCEGTIFRTVPQLVLLNEVDAQDKGFIQVGDDIEVMLYLFGANLSL
jgi:hypothetical protein